MPEKESHASAGRVRTRRVYIRKSPYESSLLEIFPITKVQETIGKTSESQTWNRHLEALGGRSGNRGETHFRTLAASVQGALGMQPPEKLDALASGRWT